MASLLDFFHKPGLHKLFEIGIIHILYISICIAIFGIFWGLVYGYVAYCVFGMVMDKMGYQMVPPSDA